jgi:hypothetical protein
MVSPQREKFLFVLIVEEVIAIVKRVSGAKRR